MQGAEDRYQICKDLSDNLTIGYNTSEVIMARLVQTTNAKDRVYKQAVSFFGTNETVLTALSASFTGLWGLHESTKTLDAMKEGVSKSLEDLADIGGKVQEAALKAGYGPTIRADAVKKLVDSVVNYQLRSREIIAEMRELSTKNAAEIRDAVETGKQRLAQARRERPGARARRAHALSALSASAASAAMCCHERASSSKSKAPLDELMLAMDVVDTLRHKELVLARELTAEDRDAKLLEQLREIYTSQGIVVTDEILQRGVDALREERFVYPQPEPSFSRTLAHAYVTRGRWGKRAGAGVGGARRRGARVPAVRARAGAAPGHGSAGRADGRVRDARREHRRPGRARAGARAARDGRGRRRAGRLRRRARGDGRDRDVERARASAVRAARRVAARRAERRLARAGRQSRARATTT